jgi:hypothetical protein
MQFARLDFVERSIFGAALSLPCLIPASQYYLRMTDETPEKGKFHVVFVYIRAQEINEKLKESSKKSSPKWFLDDVICVFLFLTNELTMDYKSAAVCRHKSFSTNEPEQSHR